MKTRRIRFVAFVWIIGFVSSVTVTSLVACRGQSRQATPVPPPAPTRVHTGLFAALEWRSIGPPRGGRVSAVAGDPRNPLVFYFGANGGGVFKTIDAGTYWEAVSDGFLKTGPVGAIEVSDSDPNVIYVGTGDTCMRPDLASGDGVYKSTDGGKTWVHLGLQETRHIGRIQIHPQDPNVVYVAAQGHLFGPNPERGVYRSRDGGKTWQRVLFKSERAGAIDISMDPTNPRVLYAGLWQFQRTPWDELSGGPDSGFYKTTDGGDTWVDLGDRPSLPKGIKGRIGVAVSPARPSRVWALVEAADGAFFRSDDSGATWQPINAQRYLRTMPASYQHVIAHPKDPDTVFIMSYDLFKSTDGGKTFIQLPTPHGDNHALWIDPRNPERMIQGNDGGANVTLNGGATWSTIYNQPTAAIYHIAVDNQYPYRVYGSQQDNSTISVPSRSFDSAIGLGETYEVGGSESGHLAIRADDPNIVFSGSVGSSPGGVGAFRRYDHRTGQGRVITIWPEDQYASEPTKDLKYRFRWDFPVMLSPHDPKVLYVGGNRVFRSTDEGQSWDVISEDLTKNDTSKMQEVVGGPITSTSFGHTIASVIRALAESPLTKGELWAGSDDSRVHLSRDGGKTWTDVSSKEWREWLSIAVIEVSRHKEGTAYLSAHRYLVDDQTPYFFKTTDYGKTWQKITNGIRANDFARVIREDPVRAGLLYAGTETGVYASFDEGASWHSLQLNLPAISVHDLVVKDNDLVIGTHSRGFWILDDVTPLRQISDPVTQAVAHLFAVTPAYRLLPMPGEGGGGKLPSIGGREARTSVTGYGGSGTQGVGYREIETASGESRRVYLDAGRNPSSGVVVSYHLKEAPSAPIKLTFKDRTGQVIRTFSSEPSPGGGRRVPARAGLNRFVWDMRYPGARQVAPPTVLTSQQWPRSAAPIAAPGQYRVQLEAAGQTPEEAFEIRKDPRVSATQADLDAQFALWLQVRDKISEAADAVTRLREVRTRVEARAQASSAAPDKASADRINTKLAAIEAVLTRVVAPSQLRLPPKGVYQKLSTLTSVIASGDGAPTRWTYTVFEELSGKLTAAVTELDRTVSTDAAAFLKAGNEASPYAAVRR
ncbi:MAG: glycosyl hydrolase [Acidobacteria bacterium]|nr:glycosyl hydrolase [Acidobacteriota bacterium]